MNEPQDDARFEEALRRLDAFAKELRFSEREYHETTPEKFFSFQNYLLDAGLPSAFQRALTDMEKTICENRKRAFVEIGKEAADELTSLRKKNAALQKKLASRRVVAAFLAVVDLVPLALFSYGSYAAGRYASEPGAAAWLVALGVFCVVVGAVDVFLIERQWKRAEAAVKSALAFFKGAKKR